MINVKQSDNGIKGKFEIFDNDVPAGEITYIWAGENKFIIDHTEVFEGFNGKGYGKELVFVAAEFARDENKKIIPLCPFAKNAFEINPDIADVLA